MRGREQLCSRPGPSRSLSRPRNISCRSMHSYESSLRMYAMSTNFSLYVFILQYVIDTETVTNINRNIRRRERGGGGRERERRETERERGRGDVE